jgi:hypothetical protein
MGVENRQPLQPTDQVISHQLSVISGQWSNRNQVVGIEDFQAFEKQAQSPGERNEPARNGRSEGDAMKFITAIGKQLLDFFGADAARLRIGGVEPEVIREDHAAGFENTQRTGLMFLMF